jgi:hypothetical protein
MGRNVIECIRKLRRNKWVKKTPGCSSIDIRYIINGGSGS